MRILFLTPQLPYPPHQGTSMRNYGLIGGLARDHEIALLSFLAPGDQPEHAEPLHALCTSVHTLAQPVRTRTDRLRTLFTSRDPDMAHRLASSEFGERLRVVLRDTRPHVVQFEGIEMIPYLPVLLDGQPRDETRPLLVFDDHNAEYLLQRRVLQADARIPSRWPAATYSLVQWLRLRRYEAWACRHVDLVAAVSLSDARALQNLVPGLDPVVVPNGIDYRAYAAHEPETGSLPPQSMVFTGKMDYRPNVDAVLWFVQHVFPLIRSAVPEATFYVVGQRPHRRLDPVRGQPGVVITGRVPNVQPYIAASAVYVIPLRSGGGTRFKVLEATAMGKAVVSTTMGCDGFPIVAGREAALADDPGAFAKAVLDLLVDPERRGRMGAAGRRFAARYDWSQIVPILVDGYAGVGPRAGG